MIINFFIYEIHTRIRIQVMLYDATGDMHEELPLVRKHIHCRITFKDFNHLMLILCIDVS